ncbi:MAG: enoyl-CoA hydratase-related protein [Candidatus Hydrogenedentes bacterium]|jgi:2-(1,2-epoxy-1,2-dihydrophenyl)acetyl-CoA isomerase|nr:enoyl-CoA hydratase-related protein [Candidatus Hydrogenedentota bacterium]
MEFERLIYEVDREAHIATITLNKPERLNAIDPQTHWDIVALCEEVQRDEDVWVIIWTGSGRGFCSGADLAVGLAQPVDPNRPLNERLDEETWVSRQGKALFGVDKPMIAAVNGVAAGAGFALTLACDLRVGSENARFVTVFPERNLSPECGTSFLLPRIVGLSRALDLCLTSRRVDAEEAYRLGLLDRLVAQDDLMSTAWELATRICELPPGAVRVTKRSVHNALESSFADATAFESVAVRLAQQAKEDNEESRVSFLEKRKPVYKGR